MQVLSVKGDNGKALFRRGKAYRLAGRTELAIRDLNAARQLMPRDPAIRDELQVRSHRAFLGQLIFVLSEVGRPAC